MSERRNELQATENVDTNRMHLVSDFPIATSANAELLDLEDRFNSNDHLAFRYSIARRGGGHPAAELQLLQLPYREGRGNQLIDLLLSGSFVSPIDAAGPCMLCINVN